MTRLTKLALGTLTALALAAGAVAATPIVEVAKASPTLILHGQESTDELAGDPSQWGEEARKVNEYEGQHRVASLNFTKIEC